MITEKTIRNEKWTGSKWRLKETLDNIAMTVEQRNEVDRSLSDLEDTFDEANGN